MNENKEFLLLRQNTTTNFLARFSTKNKKDEFRQNNKIYQTSYGKTEITISYDLTTYPKDVPNFYVGCQKLQRLIMCYFTAKGFSSNTVNISVKELLSTLGLTDNNRNRAEIRKNLIILQNTKVDVSETRKAGKGIINVNGTFNIISEWNWRTGYIAVEISQELTDNLKKHGQIIPYPVSNFKLSNKLILEFPINDRIAERLRGQGNASISCNSLYKCAVASGMKSYEDISHSKKGFSQNIVVPIENALNAGDFYSWHYRNSQQHSAFYEWLDDFVDISSLKVYDPLDTNEERKGDAAMGI